MVVSAKPTLHSGQDGVISQWYSQFCYKAYFDNENIFQCNGYTKGQWEYITNFTFHCERFHSRERLGLSAGNCTQFQVIVK